MRPFTSVLLAVVLASASASTGCGVGDKIYHCDSTHACQNGAQAGVCEPTGYCSFTDLGCVGVPRRYGSAAPDGIARFCVSATGDAGLADASTGSDAGGDATLTDAAPPDAMRDGAPIDAAPPGNCWSNLAAGPEHMCAWKNDGTYFCWGNPMNGRLGARQPAGPGQPVQGAAPPSPGSLSLGDEFTCGVASDNDLWCAGGNGAGQLGDGTMTERATSFVKVRTSAAATLMGAQRVAAGFDHACTQISGTIYCWGNNDRGQVGRDPAGLTSSLYAVPLTGVTGARGLQAGNHHNCYITDSPAAGSVWCFGRGIEGQLGTTTPADSFTPVRAGTLTGVTRLALGAFGSCALNGSGEVYCWGKNTTGRFGVGDMANHPTPTKMLGLTVSITKIAVSDDSVCAICTCGNVWCAGSNDRGRLGQPLATTMALMPMQIPAFDGAVDIAAGYHNACITRTNGEIWCWGGNDAGELGRDPVAVAQSATPLRLMGVSCP